MRAREIAVNFKIDQASFEKYLMHSEYKTFVTKFGMSGAVLEDNVDVQKIVKDYRKWWEQENPQLAQMEKAKIEREKKERQAEIDRQNRERQAELDKQTAIANMLITSGFNFDGYHVVKYSGYISGDDAVEIPRTGLFERDKNGEKLTNALVKIRRQALSELKEAAYCLGCNAVIGVDFDYITLEPETQSRSLSGVSTLEPYVICVTANGNAVIIEKDEDYKGLN